MIGAVVTFKTKSHRRVVMFGEVAKSLLLMMDLKVAQRGAIGAADVKAALEQLRSALDASRKDAAPESDDPDEEPGVPMDVRAWPLIELLEAAQREQDAVMWDSD